jgi:hypothetical protein
MNTTDITAKMIMEALDIFFIIENSKNILFELYNIYDFSVVLQNKRFQNKGAEEGIFNGI